MDDLLKKLENLEKNGILDKNSFSDIPNEVYHKGPGISSTQVKTVYDKSYQHLYKPEVSNAFHFGTAFHCFVNEPEVFVESYEVVTSKRKTYSGSKILLGLSEFEAIKQMSKKVFEHPEAKKLFLNSQSEVSFYARDKETGILKKARVDGLTPDNKVFDLKTCQSASIRDFKRDAVKYLYRISAAYYLEVLSEVIGKQLNEFFLIACEKEPPFEVAVYKVDIRSIEQASQDIRETLKKIKEHKENPQAFAGYEGIKEILI